MILDSKANHIQRNVYACNTCKVNSNKHDHIWYWKVKLIIYSVTFALVIDLMFTLKIDANGIV